MMTGLLVATTLGFTTQLADGTTDTPVVFPASGVVFVVQEDGSDDVSDGSDVEAMRRAIESWRAPCSSFAFTYGGTDPSRAVDQQDGVNRVTFIKESWMFGGTVGFAPRRVDSTGAVEVVAEVDVGLECESLRCGGADALPRCEPGPSGLTDYAPCTMASDCASMRCEDDGTGDLLCSGADLIPPPDDNSNGNGNNTNGNGTTNDNTNTNDNGNAAGGSGAGDSADSEGAIEWPFADSSSGCRATPGALFSLLLRRRREARA